LYPAAVDHLCAAIAADEQPEPMLDEQLTPRAAKRLSN
jgi:hypothetical protein